MDLRRFENHWFALQVKTGFEQFCAQVLRGKGYEEFLPLSQFAAKADRVKVLRQPQALYPGYLFCKLIPNLTGPIVTTPGVIRIVGYGHAPIPINDEEIATIRSICESGCRAYPWRNLQRGQTVRLV